MFTNGSNRSFLYRLLAPVVMALLMGHVAAANAQQADAKIEFKVVKAGLIIGGSSGSGTLHYKGKQYPLTFGGVSLGATFGVSEADLVGDVFNLKKLEDIEGTYGGGKAGATLSEGTKYVHIENTKGVEIKASGKQVGMEISLDLNGMKIRLDGAKMAK